MKKSKQWKPICYFKNELVERKGWLLVMCRRVNWGIYCTWKKILPTLWGWGGWKEAMGGGQKDRFPGSLCKLNKLVLEIEQIWDEGVQLVKRAQWADVPQRPAFALSNYGCVSAFNLKRIFLWVEVWFQGLAAKSNSVWRTGVSLVSRI